MSLTLKDLLHEKEIRRCAKDVRYFIRTYVRITHPVHGSMPFEMFDYQETTLDDILNEQRILVLKARQIGYTTIISAYVLWLCIFHPHRTVIVLSKTQDDAEEIVAKIKHGWDYLPEWMRNRGANLVTDNLQELKWSNGSKVEALPSKDDPARSRTASLIVLDEWAFYNAPEKAWASAQPVADVGGQIIALSTANGSGTVFHQQWQKAVSGHSSFKPIFHPWSVRRERDQAWYERQKLDMLEWQLHQEYPSDPDEAFIKSGKMVFSADLLQAIDEQIEQRDLKPRRGYLWVPPEGRRYEFRHQDDGALKVWRLPRDGQTALKPNRFVIGADVAMGYDFGDYSSADVIDIRTGQQVAHWHGHEDPDLFGELLAHLGWFYNSALVGVEANNHGLTTLKALQRVRYPRIYKRIRYSNSKEPKSEELGWLTTANSKPLMVDELNRAIRQDELILAAPETVAEMRTYVRDDKGKMGGSPFDDRVMSVAIAEQMRKHAFAPTHQREESDYGTLAWWERQGRDEEPSGRLTIGAGRR